MITSTDPAGGVPTWHAVAIDNSSVPCGYHGSSECPNFLTSISCPSKSLCVAGDSNGRVFTSTEPADGVSAWRTTSALVQGVEDFYAGTAVGCTDSTLCFATNDLGLLMSTDPANTPGGWLSIPALDFANQQPAVASLACPSTTRCVGLTIVSGSAGRLELLALTSTDPTAGAASWQKVPLARVSLSATTVGPVCPNTHLCVAVDTSGSVEYSPDPTGGRSAWTVKHIDRYALDGLACPTTSLCVATDEHGDVLIGKKPVTHRATRKRRRHHT